MAGEPASIPPTPSHASINRIRVVDLPGIIVDEAVRGEQAYALLSAPAICAYVQAGADDLCLPPRLRALAQKSPEARTEIPRFLEQCLSNEQNQVRRAAQAITQQLGRNLGYILLTLHRGDAANQSARSDWAPSDSAAWGAVQRVVLGGGLMGGPLGQGIIASARALLAEVGHPDLFRLETAAHARDMALLGAARYVAPDARRAVVLDMGQTGTKRAVFTCSDGTLLSATRLASVPVPWPWRNNPTAAQQIDSRQVLSYISSTICRTWQEAAATGEIPHPRVPISIAAYVRDGELLGNGIYATLSRLTSDSRSLIAEAVSRHCDIQVELQLIHDGTAAAALYAGAPDAAVLVVGTALGAGFPPSSGEALRLILEPFAWDPAN